MFYNMISGGASSQSYGSVGSIIRDCVADGDTSAGLRKGDLSHQLLKDFHAGAMETFTLP